MTEAGTPVTTAWFLRMVERTGRAAKLPFAVHPHMLRHACGFKLANDGHDTGAWRTISGIGICRAQRGTLRLRRIGLWGFGRTSREAACG